MSYINPIFTELESPQAYSRFNYPDDYKEDISITKFERDTFVKGSRGSSYKSHISQFKFKNVWPSNMTSMRVAYGDSNVLRCSVQLAYDRFFADFGYNDTHQVPINGEFIPSGAIGFKSQNSKELPKVTEDALSGLSPSQKAKFKFYGKI